MIEAEEYFHTRRIQGRLISNLGTWEQYKITVLLLNKYRPLAGQTN